MKNKSIIQQVIYFLIDTTPRQKFYALNNLLIFTFKKLVNIACFIRSDYKTRSAKTIYASFSIHILLFTSLFAVDVYSYIIQEKDILITSEKIKNHIQDKQELKNGETSDVVGIYYISPEDLVIKKRVKVKKYNSLLSEFKKINNHSWQVSKSHSIKKSEENKKSMKIKRENSNWRNMISDSKTNEPLVDIEKKLATHMNKYNIQFKKCYETILLSDSSLNATVHFLFKINSKNRAVSPSIRINGVGLPESKGKLKSCLNRAVTQIQLPPIKGVSLAGEKVKFQVVLNNWE